MMTTELLWDIPYYTMLARQQEVFNALVERRRAGDFSGDEYLFIVTHLPVYTLGRHANPANILRPELLAALGAEIVNIDRGGDVTYHGPGQLVAYPIIDLQQRNIGVKEYVWRLEQAAIDTCNDYGIIAGRVEGATGVWLEIGTPRERKICAIGIRCSRFITMHGLALNVNTDLGMFSAINPCGFTDRGVTSLAAELGAPLPLTEVANRLATHLHANLSLQNKKVRL